MIVSIGWAQAACTTGLAEDLAPPTLFSQCSAIKFEIVLGRLTVVPRHRGQVRIATTPDSDHVYPRESLFVNSDCDPPLIRYERVEERQSLAVEIINYRRLRIEAALGANGRSFEFRQPDEGDVRLVERDGEGEREVAAKSLWHLLLTEHRKCEGTLLPVLESLRPDWNLASMAERVEGELFRGALGDRPITRIELEHLVAELDSSQFQRRQAADRRLRSYGPMVLPHFDALADQERRAGRQLSGEQRDRIQRIRQCLVGEGGDTPTRVANWLADDERIWVAMLRHNEPERRRVASQRLAVLHPQGFQFDPYGDESHRQEQLAQLRLQLRLR